MLWFSYTNFHLRWKSHRMSWIPWWYLTWTNDFVNGQCAVAYYERNTWTWLLRDLQLANSLTHLFVHLSSTVGAQTLGGKMASVSANRHWDCTCGHHHWSHHWILFKSQVLSAQKVYPCSTEPNELCTQQECCCHFTFEYMRQFAAISEIYPEGSVYQVHSWWSILDMARIMQCSSCPLIWMLLL